VLWKQHPHKQHLSCQEENDSIVLVFGKKDHVRASNRFSRFLLAKGIDLVAQVNFMGGLGLSSVTG